MAYEDKLFMEGGVSAILKHPHLEADDCIALGIRYLRNKKKSDVPIWIVASDTDYLQICDSKTHLIDLKQKQIDQKHLIEPKITKADYQATVKEKMVEMRDNRGRRY